MENDKLTVSFIIGHRYGVGVANAIKLMLNNKHLRLDIGVSACLHPKYAIVTGGYSDPRKMFKEQNVPYILFDNVNESKVERSIRDSKTNVIFVCGLRQIICDNILKIPSQLIQDNSLYCLFFFQAEDGIRFWSVTGVQTCALPISYPCRYRCPYRCPYPYPYPYRYPC